MVAAAHVIAGVPAVATVLAMAAVPIVAAILGQNVQMFPLLIGTRNDRIG